MMKNEEDRFSALERRLKKIENHLQIPSSTLSDMSENNLPPLPPLPPLPAMSQNTHDQKTPESTHAIQNWFTQNWPAKLGILFILLGLGWLLNYSFTHGLLNEVVRFYLSLSASLSGLAIGVFFMQKKKIPGHLIVALGSTGAVLSLWAGHTFYEIVPAWIAFTGMLFVLGFTAALAIRHHSQSLATLSATTAMIVPFLINSAEPSYITLMLFVFLVNGAALFGLFFRAWAWPVIVACAATSIYLWNFWSILDRFAVYPFMMLAFLVFFTPWAWISRRIEEKWQKILFHGCAVMAISFISIINLVHSLLANPYQSATLACLTAIFTLQAFFVSRSSIFCKGHRIMTWLLCFMIIYCVLDVTSAIFKGSTLTIICFLETILGILFTLLTFKSLKAAAWLSLCFLIPMWLSLFVAPAGGNVSYHFDSANFWQLIAGLISTAAAGTLFVYRRPEIKIPLLEICYSVSALYGAAVIWVTCNNLIASADGSRAVALIIYTLIGVCVIFFSNCVKTRSAGMILLGAVAARLLFIEVWEMSILQKIATFLSVGGLLLLTSFVHRKTTKKNLNSLS